jgi:hypothetical protein
MRNARIPIFILVCLHFHEAECFYPGICLVSKFIYQCNHRPATSIPVKPAHLIQHATNILNSVHVGYSPSSLSCSKTVNEGDIFLEQESYTDEEVEELVAMTERLWEEAYDARTLADELSDRVEKLAVDIENKVVVDISFKFLFWWCMTQNSLESY